MLLAISICAAGTVLLFIIGITMKSQRAMIQERMSQHSESIAPNTSSEADLALPFRERVVLPFLRKLANIALRSTPSGAIQAAEARLDAAGRPWRLGGKEFIGLKVLFVGLFLLLAIGVTKAVDMGFLLRVILFVLLVAIGLLLPEAALSNLVAGRQSAIRKALPDTLDLLLVSVEAGLSLDGAIQKVVEKLHNPLSEELTFALQEMQLGKRRAEALRNMADRTGVSELSAFVAAVIQADQLGGGISRVLHVQSETLRTQRGLRAREAASKLPVKMLVPLVLCIFPSLFVVVLSPGAVRIYRALNIISE